MQFELCGTFDDLRRFFFFGNNICRLPVSSQRHQSVTHVHRLCRWLPEILRRFITTKMHRIVAGLIPQKSQWRRSWDLLILLVLNRDVDSLQYTATNCIILLHTATHRRAVLFILPAMHCNALQCTAMHCTTQRIGLFVCGLVCIHFSKHIHVHSCVGVAYRVTKTHTMSHLYGSFSAEEPDD